MPKIGGNVASNETTMDNVRTEARNGEIGKLTQVQIYTDGACSGNPGPGGWAAILVAAGREKELFGAEQQTTNQRMEIRAAVEGIKALTRPCEIVLFSDSAYLVNCMQQKWYAKWQRSGWINSQGQPVKNQDLWEALIGVMKGHTIRFDKVKGHSGHSYNERCDELARKAVKSL